MRTVLTCPLCDTTYPYGTIVCFDCGHFFVEEAVSRQEREVLPVIASNAKLTLLVHKVNNAFVRMQDIQVLAIEVNRLAEAGPLRIGRSDRTQDPPLIPEVDLNDIWMAVIGPKRCPVSRLHACVEFEGGILTIRHLREGKTTTWLKRRGETHYRAIGFNKPVRIVEGDEILLGKPEMESVELLVHIS